MGNTQKGSVQVNQEVRNPSNDKFKKLVDVVARHLPQGLSINHACIPEDLLVQLARTKKNAELRWALGDLYRAGYFGRHDVANGYAWTLAVWNCNHVSYDEKFKLAETQQYYEFFMSADEKAETIRILERILPARERCQYDVGRPFNATWWGWEDDPIPARPGERDFKAHFVQWLLEGGYSESEITDVVARCPPSDGPTRMENIQRYADEMIGRRGILATRVVRE